jgi:hypothetical protein
MFFLLIEFCLIAIAVAAACAFSSLGVSSFKSVNDYRKLTRVVERRFDLNGGRDRDRFRANEAGNTR